MSAPLSVRETRGGGGEKQATPNRRRGRLAGGRQAHNFPERAYRTESTLRAGSCGAHIVRGCSWPGLVCRQSGSGCHGTGERARRRVCRSCVRGRWTETGRRGGGAGDAVEITPSPSPPRIAGGFELGVFEGESPGRLLRWARRDFLGVSRGRGTRSRAVVRWLSRMAADKCVRVAGDGGDGTYEDNKDGARDVAPSIGWILRRYNAPPPPDVPHGSPSPTIGAGHPPVTPLHGEPGTLSPSPQIPDAVLSRYLPTRAQHREGLDPGPLISPHHR